MPTQTGTGGKNTLFGTSEADLIQKPLSRSVQGRGFVHSGGDKTVRPKRHTLMRVQPHGGSRPSSPLR